MKKLFAILMLALAGITLTCCEYDDKPLWTELEQIKERVQILEDAVKKENGNITALQTIVEALEKKVYVTAVNSTDKGYSIKFSDGKTAEITNGKDGVNAPEISVRQDEDGKYYWTLGGDWMVINGNKVCANGEDGIAPRMRINNETKEWEVSYDNEKAWNSTGVIAEGKDGEDAASGLEVNLSDNKYVVVTLKDGSSFKLERYDETAPVFTIKDMPEVAQIEYGKSMTFTVDAKNVAEHTISVPQCWKAVYANGTLTVTAPEKETCHFEKEGAVSITTVSAAGKVAITKLNVCAGEWVEGTALRVLTFEDKDAKFTPYELQGDITIQTWSDLVDDMQYGGTLTYDYSGSTYEWYDEGNTELYHGFTTPYWGGGHVISNYVLESYETLPSGYWGWYEVQMSTPLGGNNGSKNFAVHNGYNDFFNSQLYDAALVGFEFADGEERVIDHMYVTNTNYVLNSLTFGDGFNSAATEETYFKIIAYGYNSNEELVGTTEFMLCNGSDNIITTWEKWEMSSMGKVLKVVFNFEASADQSGSYGLNTPAYFAYDDVAVQFIEKVFE